MKRWHIRERKDTNIQEIRQPMLLTVAHGYDTVALKPTLGQALCVIRSMINNLSSLHEKSIELHFYDYKLTLHYITKSSPFLCYKFFNFQVCLLILVKLKWETLLKFVWTPTTMCNMCKSRATGVQIVNSDWDWLLTKIGSKFKLASKALKTCPKPRAATEKS